VLTTLYLGQSVSWQNQGFFQASTLPSSASPGTTNGVRTHQATGNATKMASAMLRTVIWRPSVANGCTSRRRCTHVDLLAPTVWSPSSLGQPMDLGRSPRYKVEPNVDWKDHGSVPWATWGVVRW